ncbi:MAG: peptide ABC transporter substrate-binding protein, partial [Verrucomicrobiales bacterium]|nr:peptide ABC transporter substrate-binding protein [Verrucomicrobiales bacterium]
MVIINGQEPETIDPGILAGQADGRVGLALFEGLTRYNPVDATPTPGLAERWELSADGRTYTFHLRTNAVWSTGEPITAHDFVYSWLRVLKPETGAANPGHLFYIRGAQEYHERQDDPSRVGIRSLDDYTFEVQLLEPTPFFLDLCAYPTFAVVPRSAIEAHGDRWLMHRPLPVSGAYQLEFWNLNDRIRLRKNPLYWDALNTSCNLIDLIPCASATTAFNLYEAHQADIVWDKELIPSDLMDVLVARPDFHPYPYLATYFVRFNLARKPFDDPRVRKALALAIDKNRIVEKITRAGEKAAWHQVPPGVANYTSPPGLGYDPPEARRLLSEAGYPEGRNFPRFQYLYNNQKSHEKIAVELQDMWVKALGIRADLRAVEWKVFLADQRQMNFDLSRSSWIGDYNDANTFLDMFTSGNDNNRTGWKNQRYDDLVQRANAELDRAKRRSLLQQAEALLIREELPIVPIYFYQGLEYFDATKIEGISTNILAEHPLRAIRKK